MHRFYMENCAHADKNLIITGQDVNHITNVLRLTIGDSITVCDGNGREYDCRISRQEKDAVYAEIVDIRQNAAELPYRITLFQGMPKSDKMELVIQKAVELGAYEIVPVLTERTVVKLDEQKRDKKLVRYRMISEAAAKQSGRGVIPDIPRFMTYREALSYAGEFEAVLIPYENAEGIEDTRRIVRDLTKLPSGSRIAVFIGPEGGFADSEIVEAKRFGAKILTLGNRILRTETAGLAMLSVLMFEMETESNLKER